MTRTRYTMTRARWALLAVAALALGSGTSCLKRIASGDIRASDLETASKVANAISDMSKDLTPENEYWVGRSVATNILAKNQYAYLDAEAIKRGDLEATTKYVNHIGGLLAAAALEKRRDGDRPPPIAGFHFVVIESDTINGFAAPGGYIFVTTAAVRAAKNEDELASLLAHEIAHVVRGHALGSIKKSRYANVSKDLLKQSGALSPEQVGQLTELMEGAIDDMIDAYFVKGYSKETEFEADKVGIEILARAGYDPGAATSYLKTLAGTQDTGSGGFYATHPKASDRIAKLSGPAKKLGSKQVPQIRVDRFISNTEAVR